MTTYTFSPSERSRLRLQAAVSMAHLSAIDAFARVTTSHFVLLALTMQVVRPLCLTPLPNLTRPQDACFHVRSRFLAKIIHLLHTRVLPFRFNMVPFLTVFDPDEEIKNIVRAGFIVSTLG